MFIESLLKRQPGTTVILDGVTYFFTPAEASDEAPHICLVEDEDHQDTFLAIPEGYRIYRQKKTAPAVKRSVDPEPVAKTQKSATPAAEPVAKTQKSATPAAEPVAPAADQEEPAANENSDPGPTEIEDAAEDEAAATTTEDEAAVAAYAAELEKLDDEALRDQHKACYNRLPASNWTREAIIHRIATFLAENLAEPDAETTGENTGE
jgi:hypothetical protein